MTRGRQEYAVRYWKDGKPVTDTAYDIDDAIALAVTGTRGEVYRGTQLMWSHWTCWEGLYDRL